MDRVDAFLTRKAGAQFPAAVVYETEAGRWELRRPDAEPVSLGDSFGEARNALYALVAADRQRAKAGR